MRIAIIDCGTNTFNLLIRDLKTGRELYRDEKSVRLGEAGHAARRITPKAIDRGLDVLREYRKKAHFYKAQEIYAFATAMVRQAHNGEELVERAEEEMELKIQVISGKEEAELILQGVRQAVDFPSGMAMVMDIGGGSTEVLLVEDGSPQYQESFGLGSSLLLEQFRPSDPVQAEELRAMQEQIRKTFAPLKQAVQRYGTPQVLIGSSGSFDTLADMCVANFGTTERPEGSLQYQFELSEYRQMAQYMLERSIEERLSTPGMIPRRADMMVTACMLINYAIDEYEIHQIKQCNYALKEGVFYRIQTENFPWPKS